MASAAGETKNMWETFKNEDNLQEIFDSGQALTPCA